MPTTTAPALVLVAHGSRDERFVATARRVRAAVSRQLPSVRVELGYLDLNEPLVGDALDAVATRTDQVIVVPLLLGEGYHSRFDLPAIASAATRRHPSLRTSQTSVVGDTSLVPALAARLREAGASSADGLLVCAVGSADAGSDAQAGTRAAELGTLLGVPVELVFATRLGPQHAQLRKSIDALRAAGAQRIALSPYFLSEGLLTERVRAALGEIIPATTNPGALVAGAIGSHRSLIAAIVDRYHDAAHERTAQALISGTFVARA